MERDQFKTLVKGMKAVYSDPKFIADKDAFDVWYSLLQDLDYDISSLAIQKYMMSNRFPPTIADIREHYNSFTTTQELNEMEAWSIVSKAIRNSVYHSVDEYSKLPTLVQRAVGQHEQLRIWALDEEYNESVVSSNFMRSYRMEIAREREISKMPKSISTMIENANVGSYKAQIEAKRKQAYISSLECNSPLELPESAHSVGVEMPEDARIEFERLKKLCGR